MNSVTYPFAIATLLVAALAAICIWSRQRLWLKVSAIAIMAVFLPVSYMTVVDLLSRPKPISLEWGSRDLSEATVLSAQLKEGERIFLWLRVDGIDEPRYYALPWDEQVAKQLYGAQREADEKGTEVRMTQPFATSYDEAETLFYALPQPARPPKQAPASNSFYFSSEVKAEDRGV